MITGESVSTVTEGKYFIQVTTLLESRCKVHSLTNSYNNGH